MEKQVLSREQILEVEDQIVEEVPVPEWGGSVMVRSMSGSERDDFESSIVSLQANGARSMSMKDFRAKIVAFSVVDADGKRMFTEKDVAALGKKNAGALQRIVERALSLSRFTSQDVEELRGNLSSARSGASGSDSA